MTFRYDLFISYARKDNQSASADQPGWITAFLDELRRTHRAFAPEELTIFFDQEEIRVAEDWELRIKSSLRDTVLLVACLSPNYFASEWCRREWELYAQHEQDRALSGLGIHPVYFIEAPGFEDSAVAPQMAPWIEDLRRRQHLDFRPWFPEGVRALQREEVRRRLEVLDHQIDVARDRSRAALEAPGTVDRYNPHFVGRREEIRRLREMLACGTFGVITAVQGLGGLGKTALANEYAHAWAAEYGGGRWLLRCEGQDDLAVVLMQLLTPLNIELNDLEKKDTELALQRVFRDLEARTQAARTNQRPHPACLVILDNVDRPALLSPAQTARLPKAPWLHFLATTRLGHDQLFEKQPDRQFLDLDELPEEDALRMIERLQPGEVFAGDAEREAACEIVRRLGGFTLAIEAVAVFLGVHPEVGCSQFLERLSAEGLAASESVVEEDEVGQQMRHREKQLSLALGPMLDSLSQEERFVLECAALLPADAIPLPWLRALAEETFQALAQSRPGYPPPWPQLTRRLLGRRLLVPTGDRDADGAARVVRMHRLVQELVQGRAVQGRMEVELKQRHDALVAHAFERSEELEQHWHEPDCQWEIAPLLAFLGQLLDNTDSEGPRLVKWVFQWLPDLDISVRPELLLRRALLQQEADPNTEPEEIAITLSNLGYVLKEQARFAEAERLLREALAIDEKHREPTHEFIAIRLNNLGLLLQDTNRMKEAEPLYRRSLAIREKSFGADHPNVASALNNLANLLKDTNRLAEAEPMLRRALAITEKSYGADHPDVAIRLNNLARLLQATNRLAEAEPLYCRALEIWEKSLGSNHPHVAIGLVNLGRLRQAMNRLAEAEPLLRRALAIREKALVPDHPDIVKSMEALAGLLEASGRFEEAVPLRQRALEARERSLGPEHPDTLRSWNQCSHALRKQGHAEMAEPIDRRVAATTAKLLGDSHAVTIDCRNNLVLTLIMLGKLDEARQILTANWRLNAPLYANTTSRIAFLRYLIALMESQPVTLFLGQLKTVLTGPELPTALDIAVPWDLAYFIDQLRPRLPDGAADFLTALVAALNDRAIVTALDSFPQWRNQPAVPLDIPWPGEAPQIKTDGGVS